MDDKPKTPPPPALLPNDGPNGHGEHYGEGMVDTIMDVLRQHLPDEPPVESDLVKRSAVRNYEAKPVDLEVLHRAWAEQICFAFENGKSRKQFVKRGKKLEKARKKAKALNDALHEMNSMDIARLNANVLDYSDPVSKKVLEPWRLSLSELRACLTVWQDEFDQELNFWKCYHDWPKNDYPRHSVRLASQRVWRAATNKPVPEEVDYNKPGPYGRFEFTIFDALGLPRFHDK